MAFQVAIVEQQRFQVLIDGVLRPDLIFNTSLWVSGQVGPLVVFVVFDELEPVVDPL